MADSPAWRLPSGEEPEDELNVGPESNVSTEPSPLVKVSVSVIVDKDVFPVF